MIPAILITLFGLGLGFLFYASYSINANIYIHTHCRKRTQDKIVAITFDDGPDERQTPKVLNVLKERDTPACFFCIGHKIKGNEGLIRKIIEEGHSIGNHSYSHSSFFPLYPFTRMKEDLLSCQRALEKISGSPVTWFRPPFGVTNPTLAKAVRELEYTTIGWNIRTFDTQNYKPEKIIRRIKKRLVPGSIILLHDRMPDSDLLLIKILDLLEKENYTVIPLNKLI